MHWTLAATILCIVIMIFDLFIFQGGGLTFAADVIFTLVFLHFVPTNNVIWLALWGTLIFALVLALHWFVYKELVVCFILKVIAPQKRKNNNDILIGKVGRICLIDGRTFLHVEDEHIPCVIEQDPPRKDAVDQNAKVVSWKNSEELIVRIVE